MTASIELDAVGKRYWQLTDRAMLIRSILPGHRPEKHEHWALRDVNFRVEPGETVGILGRNGAGKTTMLRLLAGVSRPTEGQVRIRGRVAPLIGVGVGFHHEMSGRENIYVNGMLLGLTRRELDRRLDEIVAFAELESFIDTPVKFYSTGMFMRLGFSVAAHVEPDVLLVDEVLAVGDVAFQLKCFERMRELQGRGTTILLVSHSMHAIRLLCPRALLFRKGHLEFDGTAEGAIALHHQYMSSDPGEHDGVGGALSIEGAVLVGPSGPTHHPEPGQDLEYRARIRFHAPVDSPQMVFQIHTESGTLAYSMASAMGKQWRRFDAGEETDIRIPFAGRLGGGTYRVSLVVYDQNRRDILAQDLPGLLVYLNPRLGAAGVADLEATISVGDQSISRHESLLMTGPLQLSDEDSLAE